METSLRPSPHQQGGTKRALGGSRASLGPSPSLARACWVGDSTAKPTSTSPVGRRGPCPPLAPGAWLEGLAVELSGFKVQEAQAAAAALSARLADQRLNIATWWPHRRLQSQVAFLFRFWDFRWRDFLLPFSQQGSVTIRTPCPLIGFCFDVAGYQRAQPRRFKQDMKINPPKERVPSQQALLARPVTHCPRESPLLPLLM